MPSGFLSRHRSGAPEACEFVSLVRGFLRLERDERGLLSLVSFVLDDSANARAIGPRLEMGLSEDGGDDEVTCIAENAISGSQWRGGSAAWGHTLEDDGDGGTSEARAVPLEAWMDECLARMVNPPKELLAEHTGFTLDPATVQKLKDGDEDLRDALWKQCSPRTEAEVLILLELIRSDPKEFAFTCTDPLKRARAGKPMLLDGLTALIETGVLRDFDGSELEEVIEVHAKEADERLVRRWIAICQAALKSHGLEAIHAVQHGHLFAALSRVSGPPEAASAFLRDTVEHVRSAPAAEREEVESLTFFGAMQKAARRP